MGAPIPVKQASDSWVNENRPNKRYGSKVRLYLSATASNQKQAFIYFSKPWPFGARIISAKLRVYAGDDLSGSTTLTCQRVTEKKWDQDTIKWSNRPGVSGVSATAAKTGIIAGDMLEFDVTAQVQAVANGGPWYGFRITTNRSVDWYLHSAQAGKGAYRPQLVVQWSEAPDQPTNLQPSGGRAVSLAKPVVSCDYNDRTGDNAIDAMKVQTGASEAAVEAGTPAWDSGWQTVTTPSLDLSTTTFPGASAVTPTYWRCFVRDEDGNESVASDVESFILTAKATVTMTSPTGGSVYDHSPTVAWTVTGGTQRAYQVIVTRTFDPNDWLWDTGKITDSSTNSINIPEGIMNDLAETYRIIVRVWDNVERVATANDPVYIDAVADVVFAYDNTVTGISNLAAVSDAWKPTEHLTWTRSSAPDSFLIQRSHDNGTTWRYVEELLPSEVTAGGTNYAWDDASVAPYSPYLWRVSAVVAGRQSTPSGPVSGEVRRLAPFLMRPDGSDIVCFLDPQRSRKNMDVQTLQVPLSGPPVLVTQQLGVKGGSVSGRFMDEALPGIRTAKQMYDSFEAMRLEAGTELRLIIANESFNVIAYNMQSDVLTDTKGITYSASFDWFEVPK